MTRQKTYRVLGLSSFFIGICVVVVTLLPGVRADETSSITLAANPTPSPTPEIPHTLVGSYYTVENGVSARLMLNNKGIEPVEVQPKIRNLSGQTLEIAPVFVEPRSFRFIDIQDWVNLGGESFNSGSVELFHTGRDLVLGAQIYLTDDKRSLSFEEKLGELGKYDSRRQEAVWFQPTDQTKAKIVLSNKSSLPLTVTGRLAKASGHVGDLNTFQLAAHETRLLDPRKDFSDGQQFANANIVGLSLEHAGAKDDLQARVFIADSERGYSNLAQFSNPNGGKASEYHGVGFQIEDIGGLKLDPVIVVRNVGAEITTITAKVPYTRTDGTLGNINLPVEQLNPGEIKRLKVQRIVQRVAQESTQAASLELEYTTSPGSVIAAAHTQSNDRDQVFRVPMWDPFAQKSPTGGYPWRIENSSTTKTYIKNITDREQYYVAYLTWENGGTYMIGLKTVAPHQTVEIDVKKLRDEQTPDDSGQFIPPNVTKGQLKWSIKQTGPAPTGEVVRQSLALAGRTEQIDIENGISSNYACQNYCESSYESSYVTPSNAEVESGEQIDYNVYQQDYDHYGALTGYYQRFGILDGPTYWYSNQAGVATIGTSSLATAVGAGTTTITATWQDYNAPFGTICEPGLAEIDESGETPQQLDPGEPCEACTNYSILPTPSVVLSVKPKVEILRNGQVIASTSSASVTQNVVAGEKIELTTRVTGGTGTSQWTLPAGKAIKNYVVTVTNGRSVRAEKTDLGASDLNQSTINMYWVDGGNPLDANYTVTINGTPRSVTAKFNVKKPTSTLTTTTSNVSLGTVLISEMPNESVFALHYGSAFGTPGIQFEASVMLPTGVMGQTVWAQVVNTLRRRTPNGASQQTLQGVGLDGVFPDLIDNAVNEDSPLQPAEPPCSYTFISAADSFNTWILFKPTVSNVTTIYVPLKKVTWSWAGTGTRGSDCNSWTLSNSSRTQNPTGVNTTDYPEWIANVEDFSWQ